jgi:hypothetical protein
VAAYSATYIKLFEYFACNPISNYLNISHAIRVDAYGRYTNVSVVHPEPTIEKNHLTFPFVNIAEYFFSDLFEGLPRYRRNLQFSQESNQLKPFFFFLFSFSLADILASLEKYQNQDLKLPSCLQGV